MIATARVYITRAPWLLIFPGVAISLAVISINIVGDTLRDALDPHGQEQIF
jgi:peptide/nickel transport system permease protein